MMRFYAVGEAYQLLSANLSFFKRCCWWATLLVFNDTKTIRTRDAFPWTSWIKATQSTRMSTENATVFSSSLFNHNSKLRKHWNLFLFREINEKFLILVCAFYNSQVNIWDILLEVADYQKFEKRALWTIYWSSTRACDAGSRTICFLRYTLFFESAGHWRTPSDTPPRIGKYRAENSIIREKSKKWSPQILEEKINLIIWPKWERFHKIKSIYSMFSDMERMKWSAPLEEKLSRVGHSASHCWRGNGCLNVLISSSPSRNKCFIFSKVETYRRTSCERSGRAHWIYVYLKSGCTYFI